MLKPEFSGQFKKDYKLALKRGCDPKKLERVITLLCQEEQLPASYRDHALVNSRNYKNVRECHIVATCHYTVPDYWTIGEVYERLIEDVTGEDEDDEHLIDHLMEVYTSWIDDAISNYNSDFYYQSRDYLFACYQEGEICP